LNSPTPPILRSEISARPSLPRLGRTAIRHKIGVYRSATLTSRQPRNDPVVHCSDATGAVRVGATGIAQSDDDIAVGGE